MQTRRPPGQRAGLSWVQVLVAAHVLLAEKGLESLTMRALAERLQVAPNTLYSHVPSKTALIDELIDDVLAEVATPDPAVADPWTGLDALMASAYEVLLAHPDLIPLYLARQGARGPNAQRLSDIVLALLAGAGVSGPRADQALRVLSVYTIGFAAFAARPAIDMSGDSPPPAEEMRGNYDSGLHWLLTGIAVPDSMLAHLEVEVVSEPCREPRHTPHTP